MKDLILYVHGKGGIAAECEHYRPLFPDCEVFGLDYQNFTSLETGAEIHAAVEKLNTEYENIGLIANSIGAFFSMNAGIDSMIQKAYFISPIVDMEKLIVEMMLWANVTEKELKAKGVIRTDFGEDLSWDYLCYVREHPIQWHVPTSILYGSSDSLTSLETVRTFAEQHNAELTVMEGGEHWFRTEEQMHFLDDWIRKGGGKNKMDLSKYQYIWGEEKPDWALVNSPYGYGIVNIRTQMMLMISDDELEKALIRKMEESGNAKYDSIVDAFELNREVH